MSREFDLYAQVEPWLVGPGCIINSLQRAEELRSLFADRLGNSYLFFPLPELEFAVYFALEKLIDWIEILGNRADTNLQAYGDGKILEIVHALKLAKITVSRNEWEEMCYQALALYAHFGDEKSRLYHDSISLSSEALVVNGVFRLDEEDVLRPHMQLFAMRAKPINILFANGKFGHLPRYDRVVATSASTQSEGSRHIVFSQEFKAISANKTNVISLEEADVVILSTPTMFENSFLGALVLAASVNDGAAIHIFDDTCKETGCG